MVNHVYDDPIIRRDVSLVINDNYNELYDIYKETIEEVIDKASKVSKLPKELLIGDAFIYFTYYANKYVELYNKQLVDVALINYVEASLKIRYRHYYSIKWFPTYGPSKKCELYLREINDYYFIVKNEDISIETMISLIKDDVLKSVFQLVYEGYSVKEISEKIGISSRAVYDFFYECRKAVNENASKIKEEDIPIIREILLLLHGE